jgi:hypothetical protein
MTNGHINSGKDNVIQDGYDQSDTLGTDGHSYLANRIEVTAFYFQPNA